MELQIIGVIFTLLISSGALGVFYKFGARMAVEERKSEELEDKLEKLEVEFEKRVAASKQETTSTVGYLLKQELAEFENRFLERLNGRYLQTKIAEALIKSADLRYETVTNDVAEIKHHLANKDNK